MTICHNPALACITTSRRRLPHWNQPGAIYFVTFRLADSLPAEVLVRLQALREDPIHTFQLGWIDRYLDAGTGSLALEDPAAAGAMGEVLRFFDGVRYALGDFVIMPNHVHAVFQLMGEFTLGQVLHSWKSYSAKKIPGLTRLGATVWQKESFDRLVRDETELLEIQAYVRANPANAGLAVGRFLLGQGSLQTGLEKGDKRAAQDL